MLSNDLFPNFGVGEQWELAECPRLRSWGKSPEFHYVCAQCCSGSIYPPHVGSLLIYHQRSHCGYSSVSFPPQPSPPSLYAAMPPLRYAELQKVSSLSFPLSTMILSISIISMKIEMCLSSGKQVSILKNTNSGVLEWENYKGLLLAS